VKNFPPKPDGSEFTNFDLAQLFLGYGQIKHAGVKKTDDGVCHNWGYVDFMKKEDAEKTVAAFKKL
jgi:hypothetical protein